MPDYQFTNAWFAYGAKMAWDQIMDHLKPRRILEVGSYEGASTCYLIEKLGHAAEIEIHCIDTWLGGVENQSGGAAESDMSAVEARFMHNVQLAAASVPHKVNLVIQQDYSDRALAKMLSEDMRGYFDFIYIDGSHQAADVLCDAVLAFRLLRVGGFMAFDDYLWSETEVGGKDAFGSPKLAIDAFVNTNFPKLKVIPAPLYQLYIEKLSD